MYPSRPNFFEIDLKAIAHNTRQMRAVLGANRHFIATMKANAYGYGLIPCAETALAHGADALSLSSLEDAIALRTAGVKSPILLYAGNLPCAETVRAVMDHELIPTLHNEYSLDVYQSHVTRPLSVAVKIEVGPERIGIPAEAATEFVARINAHPMLQVGLINAHPNVLGGPGAPQALQWQFQRFLDVIEALEKAQIHVPLRVLASSKIIRMTSERMLLNSADPGAALFSGMPPDCDQHQQAFHKLGSHLIEVRGITRDVHLDEAPFPMKPGMRIGIIPFGYSDGVQYLNNGKVLVRGKPAPIIGQPALEYLRIDLTHIPEACVGDEVVLAGRQGASEIAVTDVMRHQQAARVIDLALNIGPAVQRRYI